MIRIRRCAPRGLLKRPRYEVEQIDSVGKVTQHKETTTPVTTIDRYVGVAEAWALVHAADEAWAGASDEWSSLPAPPGR